MFLLGIGFAGRSAAIEWEEPERITVNDIFEQGNGGSLAVTCAGGVYAVWQVGKPGYPGGDIYFAERIAGGWSAPVAIDPGHACDVPHVAASESGDVHIIWQRGSGDSAEIMYAKRPVGGAWEIEPITSDATEDSSPDIDLDPLGRPHVVWEGLVPSDRCRQGFPRYAGRNMAGRAPPGLGPRKQCNPRKHADLRGS